MSVPSLPPRKSCFLHPAREAAARCMGCGEMFCRECVSEHELRMLCAACLKRETSKSARPKRRRLRVPAAPLQLLCGVLLLWFTLYLVGKLLTAIPSSFHDGTLWPTEAAEDG